MPENTIEIASPSSLVFGFWFFLGIIGVIGFGVTYLIWTAPYRFPAARLPRLPEQSRSCWAEGSS